GDVRLTGAGEIGRERIGEARPFRRIEADLIRLVKGRAAALPGAYLAFAPIRPGHGQLAEAGRGGNGDRAAGGDLAELAIVAAHAQPAHAVGDEDGEGDAQREARLVEREGDELRAHLLLFAHRDQ